MEGWYVIHTKPRQEVRAEEHLDRQGFRCFLPRIKHKRTRLKQRIESIEPLFPRYLFLRLDPSQDSVAPIRSTKGVIGLVRFGDRLPTVPEAFIDELLAVTDTLSGLVHIPEQRYKKGEKVLIEVGPLAGINGIFQATRGQDRVIILLEMLGSQREVVVPKDAIATVA